MEGYEVLTVDDHKVGKVVGESGNFLIIEQGTLLKSKHALPRELARVDESEQKVRVTVPKEIVDDSPKVDDDGFDERAAAEHYGLSPSNGPGTEGYGVTDAEAGDPSRSSAEQAARQNLESAEEQRARMREGKDQSGLPGSSPAMLGDRVTDIDERDQEEHGS
jgi:hypothetical protein